MPKISVIMCTYNSVNTVTDTLECLYASEYKDFEVVLVDDASTDDTVESCRRYPIKIIENRSNRGPSYSRNVSVRNSSGGLLFFLDSDVLFEPDLLGRMVEIMDEDESLAGVGTFSTSEPLNQSFHSRYFALQRYVLYNGIEGDKRYRGIICTRCGLLKRSVFDEVGGFDESYTDPSIEDYDFSVRMDASHRVFYDKSLENRHYFPDSFSKLFRRYFRNTFEMTLLKRRRKSRGPGLFGNDAKAQALNFSAILLLLCVPIIPKLAVLPAIALIAGGAIKKDMLSAFYAEEGTLFMLRGWFTYCLLSAAIATGALRGYLELALGRRSQAAVAS